MKYAMLILKVAISILMLSLVLGFVDFATMRERLVSADPFWLCLSLAALFCQFVISMLRWHDVCRLFGQQITYRQVLSLGLVGQMFNQILPTNVGGDGVRVLAMSRNGWNWTTAARTVLVDRAIGVLFIVGAAGLSLAAMLVAGRPVIPQGGLILSFITAMFVAGVLLIAFAAPLAERWQTRLALLRPVAWGLSGLRTVFSSPNRTPPILAKALLVHLLLLQSFCFGAAAIGIELDRALFLIVALIIMASAFPLSFAGWGVREGATVTGLALIGVNPTDAVLVSFIHGIGQIIIGLPGIILIPGWLLGSREP